MDNSQERLSFNKGWIVGLIDGEGSFLINKKTRGFYPSMQVRTRCFEIWTDSILRDYTPVPYKG